MLTLMMRERQHELELAKIKAETSFVSQTSTTGITNNQGVQSQVKTAKLPLFDEKVDSIDAYLSRFEKYHEAVKSQKENWAIYLAALLKGKALEVYSRLSSEDANNYDVLKTALLRRYQLTEDGLKKKFYSSSPESGESATQFMIRLANELDRWIDATKIPQTLNGLKNLLIKEQFLTACDLKMAMYLREKEVADNTELAKTAERYMDAHCMLTMKPAKSQLLEVKKDKNWTVKPKFQKGKPDDKRSAKNCFLCGKSGHFTCDCHVKKKIVSALCVDQSDEVSSPDSSDSEVDATSVHSHSSHNNKTYTCIHEKGLLDCRECSRVLRSKQSDTSLCVCQMPTTTEMTLECGHKLPVLSSCVNNLPTNMPVCKGFIGDQVVDVLRDTGCSGVVVQESYVTQKQYDGHTQRCAFIDGTVHSFPTAQVYLDTPFYRGHVHAVVIKGPLYPVIIGNIPGVDDSGLKVQNVLPEVDTSSSMKPLVSTADAMVTHSQSKAQSSQKVKPLKVLSTDGLAVGREKLISMQQDDKSLQKCFTLAKLKRHSTRGENVHWFDITDGILKRHFQSPHFQFDEEITQIVLPKLLQKQVLELAHSGLLGGHLGIKKTLDRVLMNFYWPGLHGDVHRFCQSCDVCQRTIPKGRVSKVPLQKMPVVGTPFQKIAIDLVGPIFPLSDRGHRYILSVVDYATRYPEAVALKSISTEVVAEALVNIFARVGVPQEILSDCGSQFTSDLMHEVGRLLSLKQITTTPYHPICNGLVEKFNGTVKSMLRKLCEDRPKDWDRYLGPLLFAYREVPQGSLGFFPFELLYGRSVRGPLTILKELWTQKEMEKEVKLTYQYVMDLRDRLEKTSELATTQASK